MPRIPSGRLIDATARLDPADRALLNLWVNRGLDNDTLARFSHVDAAVIAARRQRIIERLSSDLGLPYTNVSEALSELAASSSEELAPKPARTTNGRHPATSPPLGGPTTTDRSSSPRRLSRTAWLGLLAAAIVAAVVIVVVLTSAGATHPSVAVRAGSAPTLTSRPAHASGTAGVTPTVTPATERRSLSALPGTTLPVSGSIALLGGRGHKRLALSVTGLPATRRGGYQAWLYNSILDSVALGRLSSRQSRLNVALPRDYRRYRWIDVSFQPTGTVNHSGESILRAALPH